MLPLILANVNWLTRAEGAAKSSSRVLFEILAVLGGAILVFLLLLAWARYLRSGRKRRHVSGGEKVYRQSTPTNPHPRNGDDDDDDTPEEQRRRYKRRVRRRDHRGRNPTLAEVGGLPPARESSTPPVDPA